MSGDDYWTRLFPPHVLREYALIADGERGAMIGPRGDISWMCAPTWDSDAVFATMIGGGGCYAITPRDPRFVWGGYYEQESLIWRSRWITSSGVVECREALAYPGDSRTAVLLRQVVAVDAPASVRVTLDVRAGFGKHAMSRLKRDADIWTGRSGPLRLRWSGAGPAQVHDYGLDLVLDLAAGAWHDFVLEVSDQDLPAQPVDAGNAWASTENAWRAVVPELSASLADRDSRHSYRVLAGLTRPGGGMVAAATTSLPERAEAGRNYDYRYVWIRDQCYAGQAVAADGPHRLLDDAVAFVAARILQDGPQLRPAYTIDGGPVPDERALPGLAGYPGAIAKTGNRVNRQFQLDALGEALLLFAAAARHDHLDTWHWQAVEAAVAAIRARQGDADAGVWELDDQRWAHSRLTCAAGLRAIAAAGAASRQAGAWEALADVLVADAASDCLHPSGRWQRAPGDERVDAALLLPAIRGATPASDARAVATFRAVRDDLASDGYLYRFRHDQRPLHTSEGAFLLCGFVMSLALEQQGEHAEAVGWFERNRSACGPPGLLTEEFDVMQHQLRGNAPQAFVHALLFETAARLAR
ncbi:MAG: glycoside hydrolase family 15 protein [Streptosporangiaceae bacterium]